MNALLPCLLQTFYADKQSGASVLYSERERSDAGGQTSFSKG